jgi:hypothetical protein
MERDRSVNTAGGAARVLIHLALLAVLIVVVFQPLTKYFFAQDDFKLIYDASFRAEKFLGGFFGSQPGQFRPLSKFLYFRIMYRLFGLDPFPYHIVSLLFYITNALLLYFLLRKFRLSSRAAVVTAAFFALNASFINIVAWISCIQQLLGQFFSLLFMLCAMAAIEKRSMALSALSACLYLAAIAAIEQVFALPMVVLVWALLSRERKGSGAPEGWPAAVTPPLAVMMLYALFILVYKGVPTGGPYAFHIGGNALVNLAAYLHWVYDFSIEIPFLINRFRPGFSSHHILLGAVVLYNLARRRKGIVLVSCAYYLVAIVPLLFLTDHTYLIHTYIPSPAMMLLLGFVVEDFLSLLGKWKEQAPAIAPAAAMLTIALMGMSQVERNRNNILRSNFRLPRDYVLRRAIIAETAYRDITTRKADLPEDGRVFLAYLGERSWYTDNVIAALGDGSAVKLFYDKPRLEVFWHAKGDTLESYEPDGSQVLFFDYYGHFYLSSEINREGSAIGRIPSGKRPDDPPR